MEQPPSAQRPALPPCPSAGAEPACHVRGLWLSDGARRDDEQARLVPACTYLHPAARLSGHPLVVILLVLKENCVIAFSCSWEIE